jgi:hypothetical protein
MNGIWVDVPADDVRPDLDSRDDVRRQDQDRIGGQEGLRKRQAAVGAVVQGPLEPLIRGGLGRVGLQGDDEARQPADPLRPHRVALVCHRARADLL